MICITKCEKKFVHRLGGAWPPVAPLDPPLHMESNALTSNAPDIQFTDSDCMYYNYAHGPQFTVFHLSAFVLLSLVSNLLEVPTLNFT